MGRFGVKVEAAGVGRDLDAHHVWSRFPIPRSDGKRDARLRLSLYKGVYPLKGFRDYVILGDDTVIADSAVAQSYLEIMAECEVTISVEKSLISHRGACEFAKRFMVD
ncbi:hypothetical protein H6P81_021171 [Aristolochia fimbriata]|uniref:Uncharacterized protein n=1 Tax=Aristolochia fimbriata TaxID=158543 RepID=A0AAV7DV76_ARIFI|nr:hypothetical protein H6P81_021171 [Aristolochia fimbriata]